MPVNVFCLPFAGGSSYSYQSLTKHNLNDIKLLPVELPGRGRKVNEPILRNMESIVDVVFMNLRPLLEAPYAIYGHSMGSIIGYLVVKKILQEKTIARPRHLFCSGSAGPSALSRHRNWHQLPQADFFEKIKTMGGINDEVLSNTSMMQFFEPILRADFEAIEKYQYSATEPFDIPITCMIGNYENISNEEALLWQKETTREIELIKFIGKHFFIFDHQQEILSIMGNRLRAKSFASRKGSIRKFIQ